MTNVWKDVIYKRMFIRSRSYFVKDTYFFKQNMNVNDVYIFNGFE